jgi:hypothetical protein
LIKKNVLFLVGLYDEHAFGLCNCLNAWLHPESFIWNHN